MNENDVEIECIPVVLDDQGNDEQLIERFSQLITKNPKSFSEENRNSA